MIKNCNLLFLVLLLILFCNSGCEKEFTKYYEYNGTTETIYEVLKEKGDYGTYLEALDKVGYAEILKKSGLFTVLAVNDDAFNAYLNSKGYGSLNDIPEDELRQLIGYHVIEWPYKASQLSSGNSSIDIPSDPLMIKKLTRCTPDYYTEVNPSDEKEILVASERKLMPFFSKEYVEAMGISDNDVTSFLHNLDAKPSDGDIIASQGKIIERDIPAINGWVHVVDRVLEPLRNMKNILDEEEDYALYKKIAFPFASFSFNQSYTDDYKIDLDGNGDNDSVFVMNWFDFNREYVGSSGTLVNSSEDKINVQKEFVTAFIPNNNALQNFFATYYPGINVDEVNDQIPPAILSRIVNSCVFKGEAYFPSAIAAGKLTTQYGVSYSVDAASSQLEMASNGLFYGVSNFRVPDEFNSVAKKFMTDPDYSYFLVALDQTRFLNLLVSESVDYTVFAVENSVFEEFGYFLDEKQTNFLDVDGKKVNPVEIANLLKNHIVLGKLDITTINSDTYYKTVSPKETYIRISSTNISANGIDVVSVNGEGINIENGLVYNVDNFLTEIEADLTIGYYLKNTSAYSDFYALLKQAGLVDEESDTELLFNEGNTTCFAPSNDVLATAVIPADVIELKNFLGKFFIKKSIYTDGRTQGVFETYARDTNDATAYLTVNISTTAGVITVTNQSTGTSAQTVEGESNVMLSNGCIHKIKSTF